MAELRCFLGFFGGESFGASEVLMVPGYVELFESAFSTLSFYSSSLLSECTWTQRH